MQSSAMATHTAVSTMRRVLFFTKTVATNAKAANTQARTMVVVCGMIFLLFPQLLIFYHYIVCFAMGMKNAMASFRKAMTFFSFTQLCKQLVGRIELPMHAAAHLDVRLVAAVPVAACGGAEAVCSGKRFQACADLG